MDLRSIANGVSNAINGNIVVSVQRSTGSTIGAGRKQVPTYAPAVTGPAQVQALEAAELKLLANLNLQGTFRGIYLRGALAGVVRPDSTGGDLVTLPDGSSWLVVRVFESWPTWTKAAIVLQGGNQ
jgi:hypothetical protein